MGTKILSTPGSNLALWARRWEMSSLPGTTFPQVSLKPVNPGFGAAFTGRAHTRIWPCFPHPPFHDLSVQNFPAVDSYDQTGVLLVCIYFYLSVYYKFSSVYLHLPFFPLRVV